MMKRRNFLHSSGLLASTALLTGASLVERSGPATAAICRGAS